MSVSDVVEDVQGKRSVPGSNFVDDKVFVRQVLEDVFKYDALRNTLPVPRLHTRLQNACPRTSES